MSSLGEAAVNFAETLLAAKISPAVVGLVLVLQRAMCLLPCVTVDAYSGCLFLYR